MPQAATLPTHAHTPRRTRGAHARTRSLEERVAVLETHSQGVATKADISDLRSEILKWGIGALIALATVFVAVTTANTARIDGAIAANTARIDKLDAKIDARFDALLSRQDKLEERMDRLDAKLDARFDALMAELVRQRRNAE